MTEGKSDRPCVNCKLIHETERAWLVTDDGTNRFWIPKSQGEVYKREDGTLDLFAEEWLLKEKGLI
jgi:hypothetical protein